MSPRQRNLLRQVAPPILAALLILALTHVLDPRPSVVAPVGSTTGQTP